MFFHGHRSFLSQSQEGCQVSSFAVGGAVGVEEIGVAAGAEIGGEDIFFTYAAGEEVLMAGFPEV